MSWDKSTSHHYLIISINKGKRTRASQQKGSSTYRVRPPKTIRDAQKAATATNFLGNRASSARVSNQESDSEDENAVSPPVQGTVPTVHHLQPVKLLATSRTTI